MAHELTHFRHGDHIWSMLRSVCLIIHWYNPLVWAAAILSKRDAELACDEATIKALGEDQRVAYGRTLIGMTCVKRDPRNLLLTSTTMLGSKKTLKERITLIARKPRTALLTLIGCILVASLTVGFTFTGANPPIITPPSGDSSTDTPTADPTAPPTDPTAPTTATGIILGPDLPDTTEQRLMTAEEFAEFTALFDWNPDGINWYNFALKSTYDSPKEMDLLEFFYSATMEEADQADLDFYGSGGQLHKYSVSNMDKVLFSYFGIKFAHSNGVGLDRMTYNSDRDCYYHMHADLATSNHRFNYGYVNKKSAVLYYTCFTEWGTEEERVVGLRYNYQGEKEPRWQVLFNITLYAPDRYPADIYSHSEYGPRITTENGCLYYWDDYTGECTQLCDTTYETARVILGHVFFSSNGGQLTHFIPTTRERTVIYTAKNGSIPAIDYINTNNNPLLYIMDGSHLIRYDLITGATSEIGIFEGTTSIQISPANPNLISIVGEDSIIYDMSTGEIGYVESLGQFDAFYEEGVMPENEP